MFRDTAQVYSTHARTVHCSQSHLDRSPLFLDPYCSLFSSKQGLTIIETATAMRNMEEQTTAMTNRSLRTIRTVRRIVSFDAQVNADVCTGARIPRRLLRHHSRTIVYLPVTTSCPDQPSRSAPLQLHTDADTGAKRICVSTRGSIR